MRLFAYYALHALKNQIRKLFKTWIAVFILVCFVMGAVIGIGAAVIADMADGDEPDAGQVEEVETPEETAETDFKADPKVVELIVGGVLLLLLVIDVIVADKSASAIFLRADVDLLFASPMRPQSVLMFRLLTQLGLSLAAGIYFVFQIPNIARSGIGTWGIIGVLVAWMFLMLYGKLIQVLLYTAGSTRPWLKSKLVPALIAILALIAAGYFFYYKTSGLDPWDAALGYFNAPAAYAVPVWGWLKGFYALCAAGSVWTVAAFLGLVAGIALFVWLIWSIKADFYEDAMAKAEELAERRAKAEAGGKAFGARKKDRSEKLRREGFDRGSGANVYFFKTLYNRTRFAPFGFLTKTTVWYLAVGTLVALALRFVFETRVFAPVALAMGLIAFYRSLGDPLQNDIIMDSFIMIPESPWAKVFWSLAGGSVCCFLDLLPGLVVAVLILGANPLYALAWALFIVSVDYYSSNVGVFIDLSVPVSAGKTLKQLVQILFIYFGLLPQIAIFAIGGVMGHFAFAAVLSAVINVGIGSIFFGVSPAFLERGRR